MLIIPFSIECYQRIDSDHNSTRQIHSSLSLVPLPSDKQHAMLIVIAIMF